jgi:hypothetical protein
MDIADQPANFIISFAEYKEQKVSRDVLWVRSKLMTGLRLLVGRRQGVCRAVRGIDYLRHDMHFTSPNAIMYIHHLTRADSGQGTMQKWCGI